VAGDALAIAAFAMDVAGVGDFKPADGVVVHRPGEAVERAFVKRHDNPSGDQQKNGRRKAIQNLPFFPSSVNVADKWNDGGTYPSSSEIHA
jgi:hypothetical protein